MLKCNNVLTGIHKFVCAKEDGSTSIEYAILLPFFVVLMLGVTTFGIYFGRDEIASNAVNTVIQNIQRNPNYYNSMSAAQQASAAKSLGLGMVDFTKSGYYLCIQAYATANQAAAAGPCTSTKLTATNPNAQGQPYYLSVQADMPSASTITPLGNFVSSMTQIQLQQSSGAVQVGSPQPTACSGTGNFLQYSAATGFTCGQIGQLAGGMNCTQPWQRVVFVAGSPECISVPYIFAAGAANATSPNGTGTWAVDGTLAPWITNVATWYQASTNASGYYNMPYTTLCVPISFTVPGGLPAGQIIEQGNLFYPGPNNDGQWKGWVVSFLHPNMGPVPPTSSAYAGSADLCIASGGNWETFGEGPPYPPNPNVSPFTGFGSTVGTAGNPPGVDSEHESWTITFIPNSIYTGSR